MTQKTQLIIKKNGVESNSVALHHAQKSKFIAEEGMQVSLVDAESGQSVTNLQAKKSGNDLLIASESGEEFLIIEDYYAVENIEIGTATEAGFVEFSPIESSVVDAAGLASESTYTPLITNMLNNAVVAESAAITTMGISNTAL